MATPKRCFVIAPIGEERSPVRERSDKLLRYVIAPVVKELGYAEPERADHLASPGIITAHVLQRLAGDELVVADLTGANGNVFYELAVRHMLRKPLVQMIAAGENPPFNLAASRTIAIDLHDLESVERAKQELAAHIRAAEQDPGSNPITASLDTNVLRDRGTPRLRTRAEILQPREHAASAAEICIAAIHATSVILANMGFLEAKIREGCRVRIVLLDPKSPSLKVWDRLTKREHTRFEIEASLKALSSMLRNTSDTPNCEVRLIDVLLPFSMFGVDLERPGGSIIAEHQCYSVPPDGRPHVRLLPDETPYWFAYYRDQFEAIWADARPWPPAPKG